MSVINHLQKDSKDTQAASGAFHRQLARLADQNGVRLFFRLSALLLLGLLVRTDSASAVPDPAGVNPRTYQAFADYVRATDSRNNSELRQETESMWVDALPEAERKRAYAALAQGEVQITQCNSFKSKNGFQCPDCLIHHWIALVFIAGARLDGVLQVLKDYNHHVDYYAPDVVKSEIESRDGDHFRVFLRFRRQKVITVVLNTEHDVTYDRDSPVHAHSRSSATHVGEVDNPGKPNEREKPRENDNGFLWGMETWWRMEEKDNGVYVQSEVVSLTRNIPSGLGWMIAPFVTSIPKESLSFTMEATRKAVLAQLRTKNAR